MTDRLVVFGWHNADPTWCFPEPSRAGLFRQLAALRRLATIVPLADALQRLSAGRPLPRRAVALTFDDGYRDNLREVVPLLQRWHVPATFALVPGMLGRDVTAWWEQVAHAFTHAGVDHLDWQGQRYALQATRQRRAAALTVLELLKRGNRECLDAAVADLVRRLQPRSRFDGDALFLDWDDAARLTAAGFDVASHSLCHSIVGNERRDDQLDDLTRSRRLLQDRLDVDVPLLVYPNGTERDFTSETTLAARAAGYSFAVTTIPGVNRPTTPAMAIRRYLMFPDQGLVGFAKVVKHAGQARRRALPSHVVEPAPA